ncbi:MAG: type III-B CRISPR module RAMP protein Cmr6 [Rhodoferax sp.]|uniref:type III-B CRISPR module RAMP protein Cmr6 n=1 Tax=Rhodoferax sp. TaxID=50421 RepID=UPI00260CCF3F|nr:type III-B CRISPR module RAMP protein Cmr6 [Rhodoferax sp.]MDD5333031.1 type III-B CRISPR module RAMP protein Cmr6 [Rhodoferax sp.]
MLARRNCLQDLPAGHHAGLMLDKYLRSASEKDAATRLHDAAVLAVAQTSEAYALAFARWQTAYGACYPTGQTRRAIITTQDRLAIGLGNASPFEVGLTLDHTYGLPFLPGSALKGLAAAHASQAWGVNEARWKEKTGEYHRFVFGDTAQAGCIDFFDAWIRPESVNGTTLVPDVTTPHHSAYYSANDQDQIPAADWDSPVPVSFLTVNKGVKFELVLGCDLLAESPAERDTICGWLKLVSELLCEALKHRGLGGKTSSGYGMVELKY